jgi:2-methylisocitrate lyase-like PEP mutase family enzyme
VRRTRSRFRRRVDRGRERLRATPVCKRVNAINLRRTPWKKVLTEYAPLVLPSVHDALTARIAARTGFHALQVGGFSLSATLSAAPDIDLEHFGEKSSVAQRVIHATELPVLVDADDGYGDPKNVTRTVQEYEAMGAAAIFIEDQMAPKRCGHMSGKEVIPKKKMTDKLRAACAARENADFFIIGRSDAIGVNGLSDALRRGEAYLKAGVDGIYLEGARSVKELQAIGKTFSGVPLAISILEGGGTTPVLSPDKYHEMGFTMLLYPTSVLFRIARATQQAMQDLLDGVPMSERDACTMKEFEDIVDLKRWISIETSYT